MSAPVDPADARDDAELAKAVRAGDSRAARQVLERRAPRGLLAGVRRLFGKPDTLWPLVWNAVEREDLAVVVVLLRWEPRWTPFVVAASARRGSGALFDAVRGRVPDLRAVLSEALIPACMAQDLEGVERLLERGADPQFACDSEQLSRFRVHGAILRALRRAGGVLDPEDAEMVDGGYALGDGRPL